MGKVLQSNVRLPEADGRVPQGPAVDIRLGNSSCHELPCDRQVQLHPLYDRCSKRGSLAASKRGCKHNAPHQVAAEPLLLLLLLLLALLLLPPPATTIGNAITGRARMLQQQLMTARRVSGAQRWADQDHTITTHKEVWYTALLGLQGSSTTTEQDTTTGQLRLSKCIIKVYICKSHVGSWFNAAPPPCRCVPAHHLTAYTALKKAHQKRQSRQHQQACS
jgi:hypothetical protein